MFFFKFSFFHWERDGFVCFCDSSLCAREPLFLKALWLYLLALQKKNA